jgi:hypothetical protein
VAVSRVSGRGRAGEHRQARRAVKIASVVALALAVAGAALAKGDPWPGAQKKLSYPVYKPTNTVGVTLAGFVLQPCAPGKDSSIFASYGRGSSPNGFGHFRGFMIGEGYPFQCSDFGDAGRVGTRTVNGVAARVFAYCGPPGRKCTFADGIKHGYVVQWNQPAPKTGTRHKRTLVTLISSKLTFAELLRVAAGLKQVP